MSQKKPTNPFTEFYKTITNTELLIILDNQDKLQPQAIEAANNEFNNRQLSEEEIIVARAPILKKLAEQEQQKEKIKAIKEKVWNTGSVLTEALNPIQRAKPTADKIILTISVVFGLMILFYIISDFRLIFIYARDIVKFPLSGFLFLTPLAVMLAGTILFWKRNTLGWVLLSVLAVWSIIQNVWALIQAIERWSYNPEFYQLFPGGPSPVFLLTQIIFFSGALYVLCKPIVRDVYRVTKNKMIITLVVYVFIFVFINLMLYY